MAQPMNFPASTFQSAGSDSSSYQSQKGAKQLQRLNSEVFSDYIWIQMEKISRKHNGLVKAVGVLMFLLGVVGLGYIMLGFNNNTEPCVAKADNNTHEATPYGGNKTAFLQMNVASESDTKAPTQFKQCNVAAMSFSAPGKLESESFRQRHDEHVTQTFVHRRMTRPEEWHKYMGKRSQDDEHVTQTFVQAEAEASATETEVAIPQSEVTAQDHNDATELRQTPLRFGTSRDSTSRDSTSRDIHRRMTRPEEWHKYMGKPSQDDEHVTQTFVACSPAQPPSPATAAYELVLVRKGLAMIKIDADNKVIEVPGPEQWCMGAGIMGKKIVGARDPFGPAGNKYNRNEFQDLETTLRRGEGQFSAAVLLEISTQQQPNSQPNIQHMTSSSTVCPHDPDATGCEMDVHQFSQRCRLFGKAIKEVLKRPTKRPTMQNI